MKISLLIGIFLLLLAMALGTIVGVLIVALHRGEYAEPYLTYDEIRKYKEEQNK